MAWTRDLGIRSADEVEAELDRQLSETLTMRSSDNRVHEHKVDMLSPEDRALVAAATATAKAGIEALGGRAHVVVGCADWIDGQAESLARGQRIQSISLVVTRTTPPAPKDGH